MKNLLTKLRKLLLGTVLIISLIPQILLGVAAFAQGTSRANAAPKLPSDPASWVNGGPLSAEMLAGKAALFWFFEET